MFLAKLYTAYYHCNDTNPNGELFDEIEHFVPTVIYADKDINILRDRINAHYANPKIIDSYRNRQMIIPADGAKSNIIFSEGGGCGAENYILLVDANEGANSTITSLKSDPRKLDPTKETIIQIVSDSNHSIYGLSSKGKLYQFSSGAVVMGSSDNYQNFREVGRKNSGWFTCEDYMDIPNGYFIKEQ